MTIRKMSMNFDGDTAVIHLNEEYDTPKKRDHIRDICRKYGFNVVFKKEGYP